MQRTCPDSSAVSQVWQTPVRHDHRVGMSQASANSSRLLYVDAQGAEIALRANWISGPRPTGPSGRCGGVRLVAAIPGVMPAGAPNLSVWMFVGSTPHAASASLSSFMKESGPHKNACALVGRPSPESLSAESRPCWS
jgi:hypothetical protein